jgi:hypothetical protein
MWGAPSSAGWRHSATTWSQWSGTSKPQAGACHLESPCLNRRRSLTARSPVTSLPLRAENQRAFEISFFEQRPAVRQIA